MVTWTHQGWQAWLHARLSLPFPSVNWKGDEIQYSQEGAEFKGFHPKWEKAEPYIGTIEWGPEGVKIKQMASS